MRIRKGRYVLCSDEWNYWINEITTVKKGKTQGKEVEYRIAGYCTNIDKLIRDFSERVIRSNNAEDLEGVMAALKRAQVDCEALLLEAVQKGAIE